MRKLLRTLNLSPTNGVAMKRRHFLQFAAGAAALPVVSRVAWAQTYPTQPVRLLVGYAPGGAADILARLVGQWLSERLGQPFIVDNRPGAGSNIAAEVLVRAPADGYTLFMAASANAVNVTFSDNRGFRDVAAVAMVTQEPILLSVNPALPAKTLREFIAYAKANPGKLSMASPGNGSLPHIAGEMFKVMAGVDMIHVPYRGGAPAMTDLVSGQVQTAFMGPAASIELVRADKIRVLAVTSGTRSPALPDVPTVGEFVPGYEASQWFGVVAPKNTPPGIVDKLNKEINAGLADPKLKARLVELGGSPASGTRTSSPSASPTTLRSGALSSEQPISSRDRSSAYRAVVHVS